MKIKIFPLFLVIIFFIIFIIFYKGLQNSNIYTPNITIKKDIPNFEAQIFETNNKINSKDIFIGEKYYLMNIWSSWCIPCREEHNFLISLRNQKNIEIIGLNYKDNIKSAKDFLNELGNPYNLIFLDKDGIIAIEWGAYGVPESFLIYKDKVIKKIIGPINRESLLEINKLIK